MLNGQQCFYKKKTSLHFTQKLNDFCTASTQRIRHRRDLDEMGEDHPLRGLVIRCLEDDPLDRPTATEIIEQLQSPDFRRGERTSHQ